MKPEGAALVTGASRGLGRALALELARRGFEVLAGVRDAASCADLPERARAAGGRLQLTPLDVTRADALALPGRLRVLVNNAGVDLAYQPVEHAPAALWREMFETNFFGLVAVTRRAIPALRAAGGGAICNITSISTLTPVPFYAAYRASKAAVAAFGESLAAELAPFGVRVLEVLPGPIATAMLEGSDRLPEGAAHAGYRPLAEWLRRGRIGVAPQAVAPERAAAAIADAILDDAAPRRIACDPLGEAQLAAWRRSPEALADAMLRSSGSAAGDRDDPDLR